MVNNNLKVAVYFLLLYVINSTDASTLKDNQQQADHRTFRAHIQKELLECADQARKKFELNLSFNSNEKDVDALYESVQQCEKIAKEKVHAYCTQETNKAMPIDGNYSGTLSKRLIDTEQHYRKCMKNADIFTPQKELSPLMISVGRASIGIGAIIALYFLPES